MSMTRESSEYFRQIAGQWDEVSAGYFGHAVREAAIAKAYLRPEMAAADVGAGTGFMAAGLASLVRRVYVVDGSAEMLAVARQNLAGFDNIEFHEADGQSLPFDDQSLDAVFANMYLHHAVDPLAAIREMVRVLVPGGRLVITDMDEHPYTWLKDEMADVWQGFQRDQLRTWFKEAGLVNVVVDCTGQSCCAESSNADLANVEGQDLRKASISVFVATGTRRIAMREAVQDNYAAVARSGGCSCSAPAVIAGEDAAVSGTQTETKPCCSAPVVNSTGSACCSVPAESSITQRCCSTPIDQAESCCGADLNARSAATGSDTIYAYQDVNFATGYSAQELSAAPQEAADISLGCGNPLAMAGLRPGEVVLDIGSGGGLDSFLAAGKVGLTGRVIGVDMTPDMLERARATAERSGITNVDFRQGFAEALPVADGEVDVILSNCVINLTEDKGQVFREAFRVLKPGGRLEVSDMVTSGPVPLELRLQATGWSECITGALPEAEYLDLIRQAGFEQVYTRRSASMGQALGVSVYSVIASARKPGGEELFRAPERKFSRPARSNCC